MSLLLEALNRASKDKEKAAVAAAAQTAALVQPAQPLSGPLLTPSLAKPTNLGAPESSSQRVLELSSALTVPDPSAGLQLVNNAPLAIDFPELPLPEPELEVQPRHQVPSVELELEPDPVSVRNATDGRSATHQPVKQLTPLSQPEPPAPAVPLSMSADRATFSAVVPSALAVAAPVATLASVSKAASPSTDTKTDLPPQQGEPPSVPVPVPSAERVAQDIRRAYAPDPSQAANSSRRRTMVLGGIAAVLALAIGSVLFGVWGDPLKMVGLSGDSSIVPAQSGIAPPPAVVQADAPVAPNDSAVAAVAAVPAVMATAPTRESTAPAHAESAGAMSGKMARSPEPVGAGSAKQVPPPATQALPTPPGAPAANTSNATAAAPATVPAATSAYVPSHSAATANNEVVLRNNSAAKPAFAAKNRGPNALELGYAALLESRFEDATQAYAQALKANSEERDALLGLAYIAQEKGRREEAQNYYRRALRQEPGNAIANSGLLALDAGGDEALAVSRARGLAARQPDSAAALSVAGTALARDGQMADAALAFARAQVLEPTNPVHAYNHAVALDRLGRFAQARLQYEKTVELSRSQESGARGVPVGALKQRLQELRLAADADAESKP